MKIKIKIKEFKEKKPKLFLNNHTLKDTKVVLSFVL